MMSFVCCGVRSGSCSRAGIVSGAVILAALAAGSGRGRIISIVTEGDTEVRNISDWSFEIPDTEECFVPLLSTIPLQLLAYHIAIAKGRDVDQPRNLAKSVTVE